MSSTKDSVPNLRDEMAREVYEPLLPVEKKLIAWSLGTGIVLLAILIVATRFA